jgi:hypothetical protein
MCTLMNIKSEYSCRGMQASYVALEADFSLSFASPSRRMPRGLLLLLAILQTQGFTHKGHPARPDRTGHRGRAQGQGERFDEVLYGRCVEGFGREEERVREDLEDG